MTSWETLTETMNTLKFAEVPIGVSVTFGALEKLFVKL